MSDQQLDQEQQTITREHVRQLFAAKAGPDRKIRGMTEDEYFQALEQVQRQRQTEISGLSDQDLMTPEPTASVGAANSQAHAAGDAQAAHFASEDRTYRNWLSEARTGQEDAWDQAADWLNGMRQEDIDSRLAELTTEEIEKLRQGGIRKAGVGAGAAVVKRCAAALQARAAPIDPNAFVVTKPEATDGTPAPAVAKEGVAEEDVSLGVDRELYSGKVEIDKDFGPVTVKELSIKITGKLTTSKAKQVAITGKPKGMDTSMKVDWVSLPSYQRGSWEIEPKVSVDLGSASGLSGALEIKNEHLEHLAFEVKFTVGKREAKDGKVEWSIAEVTGGGSAKFNNWRVPGEGEIYLSGKLTADAVLTPNKVWWAAQGKKVLSEITGETATETTAEATADSTAEATAAGGAGDLIIAGGFIAAAVAVLYVEYRNMTDIEALTRLRADADKAVSDLATGIVSAWTGGSAPSGYWGETGAKGGHRQFDAEMRAYEKHMHAKNPGKILDTATLDEVKKLWHNTAVEKAEAFHSVAEKMFGKMVRTAVYHAWLKANSDSSLPGNISETARAYAGIPDGDSVAPDLTAAYAAARNANIQVNIDHWQHTLDP